jgi:hypothetical protein
MLTSSRNPVPSYGGKSKLAFERGDIVRKFDGRYHHSTRFDGSSTSSALVIAEHLEQRERECRVRGEDTRSQRQHHDCSVHAKPQRVGTRRVCQMLNASNSTMPNPMISTASATGS